MGVIGAAMMIQQLGYGGSPREDNTPLASQAPPLPSSRLKLVQTMITDTIQSCSQTQETASLFFDEMCVALRHTPMDQSVLRFLCNTITQHYQDAFLIDGSDPLPTDLGVPLQFCYGLDTLNHDNIALNLLPVAMATRDPERNFLLQRVSSQFKLLRVCEQLLNSGSLEAIDALLGTCLALRVMLKSRDVLLKDVPLSCVPRRNIGQVRLRAFPLQLSETCVLCCFIVSTG